MGMTQGQEPWDALLTAARDAGKDFMIRSYPEFNARFIECTAQGCGWTEYVPDGWEDGGAPVVDMGLLRHQKECSCR